MWDTCLAHRLSRHPNTAAIWQLLMRWNRLLVSLRSIVYDPQYFLKMNGEVAHMGGADEPRGCHLHVFGRTAAMA
jgi:hypothetical protein